MHMPPQPHQNPILAGQLLERLNPAGWPLRPEAFPQGTALVGGGNHFFHVATFGRGKDFGEFGNESSSNGAERNNGREHPPETVGFIS
jgi:hypothetical protein